MAGVAGISIELRHNKSGRWNGISINSNNVDAEPELKPYVLEAARLQHTAREAKKVAAERRKSKGRSDG